MDRFLFEKFMTRTIIELDNSTTNIGTILHIRERLLAISHSSIVSDFLDGAFTIHPVSGKISVAKSLDREIRDEYSLRVRADDGSWKLVTVITVTLIDDNDNAPLFDRDLYEFAVPDVKNNVSVVGKVHALDRDAPGPNSAVSYSLAYLHDFFNVDETSGAIVTKKDLSFHGASTDNTYRYFSRSLMTSLV